MKRIQVFLALILPLSISAQWVQVPSPSFNIFYNLYFINDSVGFAGQGDSEIMTNDGGRSWSLNTGFTDLIKACYLDSLNGFGITETNFYQTIDGGANWVDITDSLEISWFTLLECVNGKVFVVGNKSFRGDGYWYISDDVGLSWELRHQQDSTMYFYGRFIDDENIFSLGISRILNDPTETMHHYLKTTDGGYNWQSIDFGAGFSTGGQASYFFCPEIDSCFTGEAIYGFSIYSDNFTIQSLDFSTANQDTLLHKTQKFLTFLEGFDNTLFIGGRGFLKISPDRGLNWYDQDLSFLPPYFSNLMACHVFNDSSAVITGMDGLIIRTDNFGLGLNEANSPQPSISVYPNPSTKGYQEITLAGITPHTTCTIELFDLHGKQVKQVFS
ncbi:MAG: hypothetical protein LAT54_09630, partial [Cryomorphaceae bacterium]|nr:hypothetical protein [Cryomorphaceae bacterium]